MTSPEPPPVFTGILVGVACLVAGLAAVTVVEVVDPPRSLFTGVLPPKEGAFLTGSSALLALIVGLAFARWRRRRFGRSED